MIAVKRCPYCEKELDVLKVDSLGIGVLGCDECGWDEDSKQKEDVLSEMSWYL
ncbi:MULTISPECIES: hypothetical protein [Bacillus amyloliquefaciens group]|uniref:hypothetical protein n=1 Tax=Bacillus amyloliquefaciens group TaxID=1938374 RepID=UPI000B0132B4|nr:MULTISPECIES: hypothetical protein [Bacillus amyloliquefaciens group]